MSSVTGSCEAKSRAVGVSASVAVARRPSDGPPAMARVTCMAGLLSGSDVERGVADAGVAGVLVVGVLLVGRAGGLVGWLLVHAAATISEVSPNAIAAATALV